jgi:hypothetical protein
MPTDDPLQPDAHDLIPAKECRRRAGNMSKSQFYKLRKLGVLRTTSLGRRTFMTKQDLETFLAGLPRSC